MNFKQWLINEEIYTNNTTNESWKANVAWIPFVHGWVYAVYLLAAIQFSVKARWELRRVIWLALAGTLPIASFIAERKIVKTYS